MAVRKSTKTPKKVVKKTDKIKKKAPSSKSGAVSKAPKKAVSSAASKTAKKPKKKTPHKKSPPKKEPKATQAKKKKAGKPKAQEPAKELLDKEIIETRKKGSLAFRGRAKKKAASKEKETEEKNEESSYTPDTVTATVLDDPLQIYLRDIGRVPLLAEAEELRLAKVMYESNEKIGRIEKELGIPAGEYRTLMKKRTPEREEQMKKISPTQRRIYNSVIKEAERDISECQRLLIESNLRLVVSIAKKYLNRGLPLLDIINEGNLGLIRAVEKFDYRKGFKFSTYATWWIRQSIRRALSDQGRTIRVPVHMSELINRWIKVTRYLSQKYGREPTIAETAQEMSTSEAKILEIIKIAQEPSFLEDPVGQTGGSVFADIIADEDSISPVKAVMAVVFSDHIQKVLETLKEKERTILELRFGLGNQREHTLEEVGRMLGITRERVRQVEARALEKLRHMRLTQELLSLVGEH